MLAISKEWTQQNSKRAGQIAEYVFQLDKHPGEYLLIAVFPSRDEYYRFADDPETDRWYRQWRELLEGDPEWSDGNVIQAEVFANI